MREILGCLGIFIVVAFFGLFSKIAYDSIADENRFYHSAYVFKEGIVFNKYRTYEGNKKLLNNISPMCYNFGTTDYTVTIHRKDDIKSGDELLPVSETLYDKLKMNDKVWIAVQHDGHHEDMEQIPDLIPDPHAPEAQRMPTE